MSDNRVKELEATAPTFDNKAADPTSVPAANDTPLRKQSSDLAVLRTTNVSAAWYISISVCLSSNSLLVAFDKFGEEKAQLFIAAPLSA